MKVTIKDVAKEANVATSTVSRVLSNSPKISEKTKEKVHEAIKKLNYKPNAIARSLANNKTRILGVVLPEDADDILNNPFFINAMKGMSMYAQKKNYYITYKFSKTQQIERKHLKDIINSNLVDGVILLRVSEDDKNTTYLRSIDFPFVVVGRPDNPEEVLWVNNDNISAMYNVVEKLIKKGHRKIGFVGAIENLNMSKDRFIGYKNALFDNKISYDESIVVHKDEFIENEGQSACNELLQNKDITAIVTTDDLIAFGIMKELKLKNIDNSYKKNLFTKEMKKDWTILAPQMSPIHFQFIEKAVRASGYNIDVLPANDKEEIEEGIKYVNNDACYPSILVIGQMINALKSGKYDPNKTALIISQTGGGCRATNYVGFLKKGLREAGFPNVPIISLNVLGMERQPGFKISYRLIKKLMMGVIYGDMIR